MVVFFYKTKNYNHKTVIKTLLTKEISVTQKNEKKKWRKSSATSQKTT